MAFTESKDIMIGTKAPTFTLPGTDGKNHSFTELAKGKKATVVMFICNHCPYVVAYQDRLVALAHEYGSKGVAFVAINSNDEKNYPDDSFAKMIEVAKRKEYPFPYLRDKDQAVARAYDAVCTPEMYVADATGTIRYHGGIDDNWKEPTKVTKRYLKTAIDELLSGKTVTNPTPHAFGCSIKWTT